MSLTLKQAVDTSITLMEKIATAEDATRRDDLSRKKIAVDHVVMDLLKQSNFGKALAWGAGLGLPALAVGHILTSDARHQAESAMRTARNQAIMTALGLGGAAALGTGLRAAMTPNTSESLHEEQGPSGEMFKARDVMKLSKLAAVMCLDETLNHDHRVTGDSVTAELLTMNRATAANLLGELFG